MFLVISNTTNKRLLILVPAIIRNLGKERKSQRHVGLTEGRVTMDEEKITDMDIQALIDNELGFDRQQAVLQRIESSPDLQKRYALYVHQKNLLKLWWKDN